LASPPYTSASDCFATFELSLASGIGTFGPSADDIQRYADCAAASSDCASALACASKNHGAAWCSAHPGTSCDGDLAISCGNGWGYLIQDCTARGQHCTSLSGNAFCSDGKTCDPAMPARCVNGHLLACDSLTHLEYDSADCASDCTQSKCDGAAAIACVNGREVRVDCAQLASHCVLTNGTFSCAPNATECDAKTPDTCDADNIVMCVNGRKGSIACSSIGLTTCQAGRCR
jgi:hypothetical protein